MSALPPGIEIRGEKAPPTRVPTSRGRGLFATRSYEAGDEIAVFSKPLIVLPAGEDATKYCNYCLDERARPVKKCTACQAVAYCGTDCQRQHWRRFHKFECTALKNAFESARREANSLQGGYVKPLPAPVRALMLLILQWKKSAELRETITRLESHTLAFVSREELWRDFKMQAAAACKFTEWFGDDEIKTAIEIMCRIHTNSFDRRDFDFNQSGIFLDADLAMVNHSCIPNAGVGFHGQKAWLRAQQPIAAGDEITISYTDYTLPKYERMEKLGPYNFMCTCDRCTRDLTVYHVVRLSPVIPLNVFPYSLVNDPEFLKNPNVGAGTTPNGLEQLWLDYINLMGAREFSEGVEGHLQIMRETWQDCGPLVRSRRWAEEPLAKVVFHAIHFNMGIDNKEHLLAFACMNALYIDPIKYPLPFHPQRVKGIMDLAKAINTALPGSFHDASYSGMEIFDGREDRMKKYKKVHPDAEKELWNVGGNAYEMLWRIIRHNAPLAHSTGWQPNDAARVLLRDYYDTPSQSLKDSFPKIDSYFENPTSPEAVKYFEETTKPLWNFADIAIKILHEQLDGQ